MTNPSNARRQFLQQSLLLAGGLVVGIRIGAAGPAQSHAYAKQTTLATWVRIATDGQVTVYSNATELGQGSSSALAQILAEELEVEWNSIRVEYAPVDAPYFNPELETYQTGGSSAVSGMFNVLRHAGAVARTLLTQAAAQRWVVPAGECHAARGRIFHVGSGRSETYANLAASAAQRALPTDVALKPTRDWQLIGQSLPRLDIPGKVDGSAIYGVDVSVANLLVATVTHCPVFGGKLHGCDDAPALAVPGVRRVVHLDSAVAVVATNYWAARKALATLRPIWTDLPDTLADSTALSQQLHKALELRGTPYVPKGVDLGAIRQLNDDGLKHATHIVEAVYEVPLLAHATLEPMNATASVKAGSAELWVPTQVQLEMRQKVAKALDLPESAVTIHTTQVGGGFGRRLETDYGVEAARIAQELGLPVKVIWSREEDMQHDFYRPAAVARLRAGLSADNGLLALRVSTAALNDSEPLGGLTDVPYQFASYFVEWTRVRADVPIGTWRSVDHSQNSFFFECFIDEIAQQAGVDPVAFRRQLLGSNFRALRVLDLAAERSGWNTRPLEGRHRGIALVVRGGTIVAEVVELSLAGASAIKLHRVTCVIDCGIAVNPGNVRAQVEGGVIFGLSAALFGKITVKGGRVEQGNFDTHQLLRIEQTPAIDVHVVEATVASAVPTGCGEPPVPPAAPALVNALFAATGRRLRTLPIIEAGLSVA